MVFVADVSSLLLGSCYCWASVLLMLDITDNRAIIRPALELALCSSRDQDDVIHHGNGRSLRQIVDEVLSGGTEWPFDHGMYATVYSKEMSGRLPYFGITEMLA